MAERLGRSGEPSQRRRRRRSREAFRLCRAAGPTGSDGFPSLFGRSSYQVNGKLAVKFFQGDGHHYVAKNEKLAATPERAAELDQFEAALAEDLLLRT